MLLPADHPDLKSELVLHVFGSATPNPGPGGWAAVWRSATGVGHCAGAVEQATNVYLTMKAIVEGLSRSPHGLSVAVCTDSEFLVKAMQSGDAETWRENSWRRLSGRGEVKNAPMWARMLDAAEAKQARVAWVHGHLPGEDWEEARQIAKQHARAAWQ